MSASAVVLCVAGFILFGVVIPTWVGKKMAEWTNELLRKQAKND